jgi:hypothetical protein
VGLVARTLEARGIPTVLVSTGRDLTQQVLPPRSVFVNFPMGNPFGKPGDVAMQRRVLCDALRLAETATRGGTLVDLPYAWEGDFTQSVDRTLGAMAPGSAPAA